MKKQYVTFSFFTANGYGRSEGAVVIFLQRKQDAKRSYGTVRLLDSFYCGVNPCTFIGFNEDSIETCLKEIYDNNHQNVQPSDICFLEMDACGVKVRSDVIKERLGKRWVFV